MYLIASSFQDNLGPLIKTGKLPLTFQVRFNAHFEQGFAKRGRYVLCLSDAGLLSNLWHLRFSYHAVFSSNRILKQLLSVCIHPPLALGIFYIQTQSGEEALSLC